MFCDQTIADRLLGSSASESRVRHALPRRERKHRHGLAGGAVVVEAVGALHVAVLVDLEDQVDRARGTGAALQLVGLFRAAHEVDLELFIVAAQALRLHAALVTPRPQLYAGIDNLRLYPVAEKRTAEQATAHTPTRSQEIPTSQGGSQRQIRMAGSQDFTLDLLANFVQIHDPGLTLVMETVGSLLGLLALQQRTAHLAGSHLLDEETGDFNRGYIQHLLTPLGVRVVLLGFVEREQGLIVARGNPKGIQGLADLQRPDVLFVNRQRGAGTRVLLDYNLARSGISADRVRGYTRQEPTHTAVAMAVEEGTADCGLGVLAAARAIGLDFVPLFHERFDLVIPVEHYESALLQPLLVVLRQQEKEFVQQVAALGGYATGLMGKVLAEM